MSSPVFYVNQNGLVPTPGPNTSTVETQPIVENHGDYLKQGTHEQHNPYILGGAMLALALLVATGLKRHPSSSAQNYHHQNNVPVK